MDSIQDRVQLVGAESERLIEYLQSFSGSAWGQQSACDGWTIADVAAHLTGGAQFYTRIITRGLEGHATPPEGFPFPFGASADVMSAANAEMAVSYRKELGDGLLAKFRTTNEQMNQTFAGLGLNNWETPCYHPMSVIPARIVLSLRMFELAVHSWDIRSRLEPDAALPQESLAMAMDIVTAVCHYFFKSTASGATGGRYRFQLTGADLGDYDLVFGEGPVRLEKAIVGSADMVFQCGADDFVLLMTRRLALEPAISDQRLIIDGGRELPPGFGDWFEGIW